MWVKGLNVKDYFDQVKLSMIMQKRIFVTTKFATAKFEFLGHTFVVHHVPNKTGGMYTISEYRTGFNVLKLAEFSDVKSAVKFFLQLHGDRKKEDFDSRVFLYPALNQLFTDNTLVLCAICF